MKPKEPLTINLNVDWRVLVVLGIAVCLLVLAYTAAGAQAGVLPDVTNIPTETQASLPEPAATIIPVIPQLSCPDNLVLTGNGECVPFDSIGTSPLSTSGDIGIAATEGREGHFYLTVRNNWANAALTACASGYHMASLWEILDVTNLTYDLDQPDAKTRDDSGNGPPSGWLGWVRTGNVASVESTAGTGNCQNWSTLNSGSQGTVVKLSNTWGTAPGNISGWDASTGFCSVAYPVWCVR